MKKSELKQLINEVVRRKLEENKKPVYGYVMDPEKDDDPNDPRYQLIGYGNMPKSFWKRKLERYAEELLKRIKDDDWKTAAYFMEKNGVFNSAVNMMKELSESDLNEIDDAETIKQKTAQKNLDAAKKKQEDALKKKRDLDKRKADFERRNYPTVNKNQRLSMKADIDVGKASAKVADAEADLAKKEAM